MVQHGRGLLIVLLLALLGAGSAALGLAAGAAPARPPPVVANSVTYQINAAHDGNLPTSSLTAPLRQVWNVSLVGLASYPLVTTDTVYLTARNPSSYGTQL